MGLSIKVGLLFAFDFGFALEEVKQDKREEALYLIEEFGLGESESGLL